MRALLVGMPIGYQHKTHDLNNLYYQSSRKKEGSVFHSVLYTLQKQEGFSTDNVT